MNWNEYVNYCNEMESKRDAARKANRAAHPTFYKIMDVISTIMLVVGMIMLIYSAIQWVEEKVNMIKNIVNEATAKSKAKFDGDRYEPIDEPADDTDKECETFDDFIKRPDKA